MVIVAPPRTRESLRDRKWKEAVSQALTQSTSSTPSDTPSIPAGGSDGQVLTIEGGSLVWSDMEMKQYSLQLDDVGGGVSYVGEANPGALTSSAAWRVKRITDTGDLLIEWADGNSSFDNIWDDHLTLSYA